MAEWGFNAVRLGSMWSGVEPAEGMVRGGAHWALEHWYVTLQPK